MVSAPDARPGGASTLPGGCAATRGRQASGGRAADQPCRHTTEPPTPDASGEAVEAQPASASGHVDVGPPRHRHTAAGPAHHRAPAVGRRPRRALAAVLLGALVLLVAAAPAQAAGYRYWSFWRGADGGAWTYQQQGPAIAVPPDGAVDGWRFAVSPDGGQDAAKPRATARFDEICAGTPAQDGRKRVAVVLDFGTAEDAGTAAAQPPGQRTACAGVAPRATSAEVLAAVAPPLRYDSNGLLCAIAGYPKAGCGDQVDAAAGAAEATPPAGHGSGPDVGPVAGGALVAVLAGGAVWQARRRRHS
ncbi:SCO2322 family protein [Kitasatospora cathayae]|uniref:SCO2322 family protein n=1 Tax=Kitasatospora cathayae TaxID=3004092 RepID=UPI003860178C